MEETRRSSKDAWPLAYLTQIVTKYDSPGVQVKARRFFEINHVYNLSCTVDELPDLIEPILEIQLKKGGVLN